MNIKWYEFKTNKKLKEMSKQPYISTFIKSRRSIIYDTDTHSLIRYTATVHNPTRHTIQVIQIKLTCQPTCYNQPDTSPNLHTQCYVLLNSLHPKQTHQPKHTDWNTVRVRISNTSISNRYFKYFVCILSLYFKYFRKLIFCLCISNTLLAVFCISSSKF